jgi:hypothetical protein
MQPKNEPTSKSKPCSSLASPERAKHLLSDLKAMVRAGQIKLAPGWKIDPEGP